MNTNTRATDSNTLLRQDELASIEIMSVEEAFADDRTLLRLEPKTFVRVDSWQRLAVRLALGSADSQVDAEVYALVWSYTTSPSGDGTCYASCKAIAPRLGYGEQTVRRSVERLIGCKLIRRLPPKTCTSVKTLVATANHPAAVAAQRWNEGEYDELQAHATVMDNKRAKLAAAADAFYAFVTEADDNVIDALVGDSGEFDFDKVLNLVGAASKLVEAQGCREAHSASESHPAAALDADTSNGPVVPQKELKKPCGTPDLIDLADAPEGYQELADLAAGHNGNKIRWRESLAAYNELVDDGYTPDEIADGYRAMASDLAAAGVPDGKYPNIYAYLTSTASCTGSKGARRRMDDARERRAREEAAERAAGEERERRAREDEAAREYKRVLEQLVAEDAEYQAMDAELTSLTLQVRPGAQPGDPAHDARMRLDELAPKHAERYELIVSEARRRCKLL